MHLKIEHGNLNWKIKSEKSQLKIKVQTKVKINFVLFYVKHFSRNSFYVKHFFIPHFRQCPCGRQWGSY